MTTAPSLTLGIPVYNGASFLRPLVESLLGGTFTDFELLVSDNGSTDGTRAIAESLRGIDPRVTVNTFDSNQGVQANFNWLLEHASAPLFKWCAVGDLIGPDYLKTCVDALRADPRFTLAHTRYDFVQGDRHFVRGASAKRFFDERIVSATQSKVVARRVNGALRYYAYGGHFFGVHRTELIRRLGGHAEYAGTDRVLTAELAAAGPFFWDDSVQWSCQIPTVETVDYVANYGLKDGKDYPDIERLVARRGFACPGSAGGALTRVALETRRASLRARRLTDRLSKQSRR